MAQDEGNWQIFGGVSGVGLPLKLINPLEPGEDRFRNIVYRARSDGDGRVVEIEKRVQGAVHLIHRYDWSGDRLARAEIEMDGDVSVIGFDAAGRPVRVD